MSAPTPANMDTCDPKCKCNYGPYVDQAYSCDNPCAGQNEPCTFSCQNGCECGTPCTEFRVEYLQGEGCTFSDGPSCGTCTGETERVRTIDFGLLTVVYSGDVHLGSLSAGLASCVAESVNCGLTVQDVTGADLYIFTGGASSAQDASGVSFPCGVNDRVYALFTVTDDPSNGAMAGTIYAALIGSSTTGAVCCMVQTNFITAVLPVGCS